MKKFLKITGITFLVLLLIAFLIPVLFKKQITELVKKEINKSLTARVDFTDLSLSLFRHFPKISIALEDLSVVGTGTFENDTLVAARSIDVSADLLSVIKGENIKVSGIFLQSPRIRALVNADGQANWDIVKDSGDTTEEEPADTSASAFQLSLKKYEISDGYIYYRDETMGLVTEIAGLDHEGSGDFTSDVFTLSTQTNAKAVDFSYAGIPYLANTRTILDADIQIDNAKQLYSFDTDDIQLNNLKLSADGSLGIVNDSTYSMDFRFKTPSNEFRDILSLVPAIYRNDFDKIETSGTAAFEGWVKGQYNPVQLPAYDVKLAINDGSFKYPDLPQPVRNIQLDLQASNPDGVFDNTVINLSKGHLEMGQEPFDFRFLLQKPETSQYIDAAIKGQLDLAQVGQFVKLPQGTRLAGQVRADAFAKGNMSAIQNQAGPFSAGGDMLVSELFYSAADFPQPIQHGNMTIKLANEGGIADNTRIEISNGHIELGPDPFDFRVTLAQPMSSQRFDGSAKGRLTLANIAQFTSFEPGTELSGQLNADLTFAGSMDAINKGAYEQVKTSGTATIRELKYKSPDYPTGISMPLLDANFTPRNLSISQLRGSYLGTQISGQGSLDNMIGYAIKNEALRGSLDLELDKMNLNQWMGTSETNPATAEATAASGSPTEPFLVPGNLDLKLTARAGEVIYDKVSYRNIKGALRLANETVELQNVSTEALGGSMLFNGTYSTLRDKKNPDIALSYDVKGIDIQKAFQSFVTVEKLMPIGQFLAGKLSSQLTMTGNLNGNMMPDLTSLSGKGNMLLLEGVLRKFAPLEKLANSLQIAELQSITLKDIRNSIEFANGKVLVKPFTIKVKDIEMEIGGMHGFDQSIEYVIGMKLPRKYLGNQGNALVNNLATEANKKGIPVQLGETVNLNVKMGGSISNPTIRTDLKEVAGDASQQLKEQAADFAQQKIDSAKSAIRDTLTSVKNQVVEEAKEKVKEELKDRLFGTRDSTKKATDSSGQKPKEQVKETLKGLFNKPKKNVPDTSSRQ